MSALIRIIDVSAEARELFGDQAEHVAGRALPEHDYRFEVVGEGGRLMTFGRAATAAQVATYLAELGQPVSTGGES